MRNIKVICKGVNSPSGKRTNVEFYVSEGELKEYKKIESFGLEVIEYPKKAEAPKKTKKKKPEEE